MAFERDEPATFARSMRDLAGASVSVRFGPQMTYELRAQSELLGLLEPPEAAALWRAQAVEASWQISLEGRRGWRLQAIDVSSGRPAARFDRAGLRAGGRIETLHDGQAWMLRRRRPWSRHWRVSARGAEPVLVVESEPARGERMRVDLGAAARTVEPLSLLVVVALSVIVLEEVTAAPTGAAG